MRSRTSIARPRARCQARDVPGSVPPFPPIFRVLHTRQPLTPAGRVREQPQGSWAADHELAAKEPQRKVLCV